MTDALQRLSSLTTPVPAPKVSGHWFSIRYCPDLAGGELFNIGVGYVDAARNRVHARLIENRDAFRVVFGESFVQELRFVLDVVKCTLARHDLAPPLRSLIFGDRRFAAGESAQELLDRLFETTVSFSEPLAVGAVRREVSQNNSTVRKAVFDAIRLKANLGADRIIAPDAIYQAREGDRTYPLDIPIRSDRLLGSLVSAAYRTKQPLENNLLRASLDLETAARIFRQDRLGFFVMRSVDALDAAFSKMADDVIDTIGWKLHKQGVHVGVEDTPERLADEILSWSGI
jgi:hypothetical protein